MNLQEIITNSLNIDDDLVVYAKKIDGRFLSSSDAVLLKLKEDEQEIKTNEIADNKCPGFHYFMEMFLIKEMMEDFNSVDPNKDIVQKISRLIHYVEFDA